MRLDHTLVSQSVEPTGEIGCRRPSLVGDDMARHVGAALYGEHQVEAHDVERIPVGTKLSFCSSNGVSNGVGPY